MTLYLRNMTDILNCIHRIRCEFQQLDLKVPAAILLGSRDDGYRFLGMLMQKQRFVIDPRGDAAPVKMADGTMWMEVKVMGIAVRWPASTYAQPNGEWYYA